MATHSLPLEVLQAAVDALEKYGSKTEAAKALGLPRGTLDSRIQIAQRMGLHVHAKDMSLERVANTQKCGHVVMHIPDLHCPFMHQDAPDFIRACVEKYKPTVTVLAGDELDQHAISAHDADPNGFSPGHELTAGLKQLEQIYAIFKEALVCESNHGQRPFKRAYKAGLPSQYIRTYVEFMHAPQGWVWAEEFELDGVVYSHGEAAIGQNGALNLAIRQGKSQAIGHWHGNAGASYFYNGTTLLFGLYSGCLIDAKAYAFRYGKHAKQKPILGLSMIEYGIPRFIPMHLDKDGRWTGAV